MTFLHLQREITISCCYSGVTPLYLVQNMCLDSKNHYFQIWY